jgi:hypothetical protein
MPTIGAAIDSSVNAAVITTFVASKRPTHLPTIQPTNRKSKHPAIGSTFISTDVTA